MNLQQTLGTRTFISGLVLFAFLSSAQRHQRRIRHTTTNPDLQDSDIASKVIIGSIDPHGRAAISPRAREIIQDQNSRERKNQLGAYPGLNIETVPTVNCTASCTPREAMKQLRVETIKMDILRKLRLSRLPNMTNQRIPDIPIVRSLLDQGVQQHDSPVGGVYVDELSYGDEYDLDDDSTTLRTIIFSHTVRSSSSAAAAAATPLTCHFTLQSSIHNSDLINATFGVYVRRTGSQPVQHPALPASAFLYRIRPSGRPEVYLKKRLQTWSSSRGHWVQFDVKAVVEEWISKPDANRGLQVVVEDVQGRFEAVLNPTDPEDEPYKPFLDVSVVDRARSRSKRQVALTCEERDSERRCCRYPLIIDFEAFRWDWVIAPRSYHAYYCSGECPVTYFQTYPHTHVVQQVRADVRNGGPCCSPRDLSPISLLYFDNQMNIISGILPGMVVNRCSCA